MAYVAPFIRMSFGGAMADGNEIWSCNLHLVQADSAQTPTDWFISRSANIAAYGAEVNSFVSATATRVPDGVKLDWIKMALVGTDGLYLQEPVEIPLAGQGGLAAGYLPQGAIVNTLVSDVWKDPGRYNRFYLPVCAPNVSGLYALSSAQQVAYADALVAFVQNINTLSVVGADAPDAPVGVVSGTGTGSSKAVVDVRVGRIIDTQRRRRNGLTESYETRTVQF